jgi:hypothetical protein
MDSGSSVHAAGHEVTEDMWITSGPSGIQVRTASGSIAPGKMEILTKIRFDGSEHHYIKMHIIATNETWLFSMDKLASLGFDFFLTNAMDKKSYMQVCETGERIILRRQHPESNTGFWYLDLKFDGPDGYARVLNTIEHGDEVDIFHLSSVNGSTAFRVPHIARVRGTTESSLSITEELAGHGAATEPQEAETNGDGAATDFMHDLLYFGTPKYGQVQEWKGRHTALHVIGDETAKMLFQGIIPLYSRSM